MNDFDILTLYSNCILDLLQTYNDPWCHGLAVQRDDECFSIEWPTKGLFICIYTDSVVIDKVSPIHDEASRKNIQHDEKEFIVNHINDIIFNFKPNFDMVI